MEANVKTRYNVGDGLTIYAPTPLRITMAGAKKTVVTKQIVMKTFSCHKAYSFVTTCCHNRDIITIIMMYLYAQINYETRHILLTIYCTNYLKNICVKF